MDRRVKLLQIIMFLLVIFSILLFVVMIIIGHTNSFNFSQVVTAEQTVYYVNDSFFYKSNI